MATETRKYTPAENKARRLKAADEAVDLATRKLEKAEKRVTDATALVTKRDEAKADLAKAKRHRDWVASMPVDGEDETPAGTETQETGVLGDIQDQDDTQE